jgi:hypothetical protein
MPEVLDVSELLANTYEPKRQFRWIIQIDGLDAFVLKTAARPQITFEETTIDYLNVKRYLSGKGAFGDMAIKMHDPINPSASQKVLEWIRLNFESTTGRMGYASQYKRDFTLKLLAPDGVVVELWDIKGAWPKDINFGDLDYASSDPVEVSCTIRYDGAVQQF